LSDDFTRRRFEWLDQITADPAVTPAGFVLAYWIAKHINRNSGDAWPSQPLLATEMRLSVRTVRALVDQLERAGHLTVIASRGRGHSCRYRPILRAEPSKEEPDPEPQIPADVEPEPLQADAEPQADLPSRELFGNIVEASPKPATRAKGDLTADFEAWWLQYPRKVSKGAASKAYDQARKSGATADDLETGAMRYSAARTGEDPKFTKHGATWLHNKCWLDEPEPSRSGNFDRPPSGSQRQAPLSHLEVALAGLTRDE
jgi:hypothetical protein